MFERGATLRAAPGPLTGLGVQLLLLAALASRTPCMIVWCHDVLPAHLDR